MEKPQLHSKETWSVPLTLHHLCLSWDCSLFASYHTVTLCLQVTQGLSQDEGELPGQWKMYNLINTMKKEPQKIYKGRKIVLGVISTSASSIVSWWALDWLTSDLEFMCPSFINKMASCKENWCGDTSTFWPFLSIQLDFFCLPKV